VDYNVGIVCLKSFPRTQLPVEFDETVCTDVWRTSAGSSRNPTVSPPILSFTDQFLSYNPPSMGYVWLYFWLCEMPRWFLWNIYSLSRPIWRHDAQNVKFISTGKSSMFYVWTTSWDI